MTEVIALRSKHREQYTDRYGVKLGFMSFFVKAAVDALKIVPQLNAEVREPHIVYRNYYDIGVAVGGGKGLVVPVLRNAEFMSFAEIEQKIADFARRAADNKLKLEELQGGTFTISNGGVYGSMLSTPIINPPQSGILGLHAIEERPAVRDGQVVARPMMYVALTYDHRIVDGREAVTFLKRIKEVIEDPAAHAAGNLVPRSSLRLRVSAVHRNATRPDRHRRRTRRIHRRHPRRAVGPEHRLRGTGIAPRRHLSAHRLHSQQGDARIERKIRRNQHTTCPNTA